MLTLFCLQQQKIKTIKAQKLSTENLKKFIARRRWAVSRELVLQVNMQTLLTKLFTWFVALTRNT